MKYLNYYSAILFIAILSTSCGDNKNKGDKGSKMAKDIVEEAPNAQNTVKLLRNKTPLTKEDFEKWLPKTLINLPKTSSITNLIPGMGSCSGNYNVGNKRIRVMVIDGAGEKGAGGVGPYMMSSKMDYDQKESWGYTKTRTINGIKVKETYQKGSDKYTLSMFYKDRFAVDIETSEVNHEELERALKELNLGELGK